MARFGLKSALPLALVLGFAAVSTATMAQAPNVQDPNKSRLNDPANQRNLNDQQDPKTSRLNDPANARNLQDQQDPKNSRLNDPASERNLNDSKADKPK
jgi:hypothetical protein